MVGGVWIGNDDYSSTNRMTGGSLPAQTWHDIMTVAHQGIEIKELTGVGMGVKLPPPVAHQVVAANGAIVTVAPKIPEIKPGPPPVLTKRGADILVQVEKMLDDAAKAADKSTSANEPPMAGSARTSVACADAAAGQSAASSRPASQATAMIRRAWLETAAPMGMSSEP